MILASRSPRRKVLLKELGYDFKVDSVDIDETFDHKLKIDQALMQVAFKKAASLSSKYPNELIIGADTIVYHDGNILGKPTSKADAYKILKSLSNKSHEVKTGVCILFNAECILHVETTKVYFKALNDEMINAYIETGKCMDKAGAYGIQECNFVDHYDGSYTNVVGLPNEYVKKILSDKFIAPSIKE